MADIELQRLICIVTGAQLTAEVGDRPLAYRVQAEVERILRERLGPTPEGGLPLLAAVVISDVLYLNNDSMHSRPLISIGGPGVNAVAGSLVDEVPSAVAIENSLLIQMDLEFNDMRCAVWGMTHLETVQAVELFIVKEYLAKFVDAALKAQDVESDAEDDDPE